MTLLSPGGGGAYVFHKHMSSLILHLYIYPYAPTKYYQFSDKYHARFHVYGLHQAAWIERESNPRSLKSQAEDQLRPLGHSDWWRDVFKNLIE